MEKAVGYVRVSKEEQVRSGLGLAAQRRAISAAARDQGYELAEIFADPGKSGALPLAKRPGLLACVTAMKGDRSLRALFVARRDRLGRDAIEVGVIEKQLRARKQRVISAAGEGTENDDPTSVLMRRMLDAFSEHERALIGARIKAALDVLKSQGVRLGAAPFGWRIAGVELVEVDAEQLVIRQVVEALASEGTHRGAMWKLRRDGVVSPRSGKPLGLRQCQRIWRRNGGQSGKQE